VRQKSGQPAVAIHEGVSENKAETGYGASYQMVNPGIRIIDQGHYAIHD